ncbi:hypothetical protein [Sporichthya sp.]|uniref:hypothetical protein n=1 Tax=Sporichthya sp. TaxID=65475 RepID=UPI0017C20C24|nr:hypothetical protein [Sporichthya sp.]MBA3741707.1 hypothetical protein [Sporichthya sp.]
MAFRLEHPFSGAIYTGLEDGRVEVAKGEQRGIFDFRGTWVAGELRTADPELCRWVGTQGYTPASRHLVGFTQDHGVEAERQG